MVEEELEAQGNQLDRVCGDESHVRWWQGYRERKESKRNF